MVNASATWGRPLLRMDLLQASGLFDPEPVGVIGFALGDTRCLVRKTSPLQLEVGIESDGELFQQTVNIGYSGLRFGLRMQFVCPFTDTRCNVMYLCGYTLASSEYHDSVAGKPGRKLDRQIATRRRLDRLLGSDLHGPARGKNRQKLIEDLDHDDWLAVFARDKDGQIEAALTRTRKTPQRRPPPGPNQLSAEAGFNAGQRIRVQVDGIDSADLFARFGSAQPLGPRALQRAFVEDFPFLTIGDLKRQNLLRPGMISAWELYWTEQLRLQVECHLFDLARAYVYVRSRFGERSPQRINLVQADSKVGWLMVCPFTGKRRAKLFYRDNLFGSPEGNRLIHRSQRKA